LFEVYIIIKSLPACCEEVFSSLEPNGIFAIKSVLIANLESMSFILLSLSI